MTCAPDDIEPGRGWTCENGHRHFVCYVCHEVRTSKGTVDHVDDPGVVSVHHGVEHDQPEDVFSVCDDCQPRVMAQLRRKGLIP